MQILVAVAMRLQCCIKLKCLGELPAQHRLPHATEKPEKLIVFELPSEVLQTVDKEFTSNFPLPFEIFR